MAAQLSAELVPQPTGADLQTVFASQLGLGDLGDAAEASPSRAGKDRTYGSNATVWSAVLDEKVRVGQCICLRNFVLSEWLPLSPGLFHTEDARWKREFAQQHLLRAADDSTLAELERGIGRRI